jgi:hypothetical protein
MRLPFIFLSIASAGVLLISSVSHAGTTYEIPSVKIQAPGGPGWLVRQQSRDAVIFDYAASNGSGKALGIASHFEPSWPSTEQEFIADIKRQSETMKSNGRILSSKYETEKRKSVLCVRAYVVSEASSLSGEPQRLHSRTIACRKSAPSRDGLFGHFEYVANSASPELDAVGEQFFSGIQFSSK